MNSHGWDKSYEFLYTWPLSQAQTYFNQDNRSEYRPIDSAGQRTRLEQDCRDSFAGFKANSQGNLVFGSQTLFESPPLGDGFTDTAQKTYRGIEVRIRQTPVYRLFTGFGVLQRWKRPDHTKIEEFRNRVGSETHKQIGHHVLTVAATQGFADASWMDIDSTVQEANMTYPADATLMKKLFEKCHKVIAHLKAKKKTYAPKLSIDIEFIRKIAQSYFFLKKTASTEERRELFKRYHRLVKNQLRPAMDFFSSLTSRHVTLGQVTSRHGKSKLCRGTFEILYCRSEISVGAIFWTWVTLPALMASKLERFCLFMPIRLRL